MTKREVKELTILGEYIDSFVHDGILYILRADSLLTSYRWGEIKGGPLLITERELKEKAIDSIQFSFWPIDMNFSRGHLYISRDDGVYEYAHLGGHFLEVSKRLIYKGRVNRISIKEEVNGKKVLALAACNHGLILIHDFENESLVSRVHSYPPSYDCLFIGDYILSDDKEGINIYPPFPREKKWAGPLCFGGAYRNGKALFLSCLGDIERGEGKDFHKLPLFVDENEFLFEGGPLFFEELLKDVPLPEEPQRAVSWRVFPNEGELHIVRDERLVVYYLEE